MCDDFDSGADDQAAVWDEKERKARKKHRCVSCQTIIEPGSTYKHVGVVYDGYAYSLKQCSDCASAQTEFGKRHRQQPLLEDLRSALEYCVRQDGPGSWAETHLKGVNDRWDAAPETIDRA